MKIAIVAAEIAPWAKAGGLADVIGALPAAGANKTAERMDKSAQVLNEIMKTPEQGIPRDLLDKAVCVAVIPY